LASYAKYLQILVHNASLFTDLTGLDLLHLPLSEAAYIEFITLIDLIQRSISSDEKDLWTYPWGANYSVSKAYAFFMHARHPTPMHPTFSWLWKSCWLLLQDRLNTRDLLQRK
jgi:hypothetical protein